MVCRDFSFFLFGSPNIGRIYTTCFCVASRVRICFRTQTISNLTSAKFCCRFTHACAISVSTIWELPFCECKELYAPLNMLFIMPETFLGNVFTPPLRCSRYSLARLDGCLRVDLWASSFKTRNGTSWKTWESGSKLSSPCPKPRHWILTLNPLSSSSR